MPENIPAFGISSLTCALDIVCKVLHQRRVLRGLLACRRHGILVEGCPDTALDRPWRDGHADCSRARADAPSGAAATMAYHVASHPDPGRGCACARQFASARPAKPPRGAR